MRVRAPVQLPATCPTVELVGSAVNGDVRAGFCVRFTWNDRLYPIDRRYFRQREFLGVSRNHA